MELRLDHDFKAPDELPADAREFLERLREVIVRLEAEGYAVPDDIDLLLNGIGARNTGRAGLRAVHQQTLDHINAARVRRAGLERIEWVSSCQDNISIPAGMLSTSSTH